MLVLLARRSSEATVCPSEVARALAAAAGSPADWRDWMVAVHAAVDRSVQDGTVELSWRGRTLSSRDGPYRIHRPAIFPDPTT